ncbi:hypothetical protein Y032_0005g2265 [Ancylostoma ceylanicum]|uniref:Uncharacterized protein n=1 Tax=Ancylostoma ceylanicum TaxID=53326 RepID=A0A016VSN3_9BILA|nr:hypothetical protein Y032_0005g2265 [Ancylostoma ceylanicum]
MEDIRNTAHTGPSILVPWKIPGQTPRERMASHSVLPLDISNVRGLRIEDYGQLTHSHSILYYIADKYDKETNKALLKPVKRSAEPSGSELDLSAQPADQIRRKQLAEWERHANKLRRRHELETYNARRSKSVFFGIVLHSSPFLYL